MWIEISKDIFENSDFKGLNFLYQILSWYPNGSIPRYKIFIDLEEIKNTLNYKSLEGIEVKFDEVIESQFNEFITKKSKNAITDYCVTDRKAKKYFDIEESIRFFSQPVSIVLENNKNDSFFVVAIIKHFGKRNGNNNALQHLKNGWIKFENAGGCSNIENFITGFLSTFDDLAFKKSRPVSDYFRGLIIIDSDKEFSNQPSKHTKLIGNLNSKGIYNIHILEKRMMENYMPNEVFEEIKVIYGSKSRHKDLVKWVNVYVYLNDEQKDHLKYYDGFNVMFNELDSNIQTIYLNQSQNNFNTLKDGFNYKAKEFKNEFPLLFRDSLKVNKYTLSQRCGTTELQDILDKIINLL